MDNHLLNSELIISPDSFMQVSSFTQSNEAMDDLGRLVEKIKFCLQKVCANSCTVKERDQHQVR